MNSLIIDLFHKLIKQIKAEYLNAQMENDIKEIERNYYKLQQTKRILSIILSLNFEITSENDLKNMSGIGKGTLNRIKEILATNNLSELDERYIRKGYDEVKKSRLNNIQELLKIIGVGDRLARKLVLELGITTVDGLKEAIVKNKIRVSRQVKLGLQYYNILERNIPRSEIEEIEKYLFTKSKEIDPKLNILLCGSYRRGIPVSGDIDVMIYHPDVRYVREIYNPEQYGLKSYLILFVELLTKEGFLLDYLSVNKMKYMGFCKAWDIFLQSEQISHNDLHNSELINRDTYPVRRIDILFIPFGALPTAMLYFTGPYELNIEMRQMAKKKNMLLDEYGLYIINTKGQRIPMPISSEKDVFEELGMKYLTPNERQRYASKK